MPVALLLPPWLLHSLWPEEAFLGLENGTERTKTVFHRTTTTELDLCATRHKRLQLMTTPVILQSNKSLVIDYGGKRGGLFIFTSHSIYAENNPKLQR